jgi:hypothetical protein
MSTPPLSRTRALEAVRAVEATGSPSEAAKALGVPRTTIYSRLEAARLSYGITPADKLPQPAIIIPETISRPRVRVKAVSSPHQDAPITRVLGIGDLHDSPSLDKERFRWIGRHAAATRPDRVVMIGDVADFDSLSSHAKPGSAAQKLQPSYASELESLEEAFSLYRKEAEGIRTENTAGNHEGRVWRFEDASASAEGMFTQPLMDVFARFDIKLHKEGEWLLIDGVAFVHCPRSLMGREMGGRYLNQIAADSRTSLVFGHIHRGQVMHAHKIGPWGGVTIVNLGTALPHGYIKPYAQTSASSWTWGVYDLTIQAGHIVGHQFICMDRLKEMYA